MGKWLHRRLDSGKLDAAEWRATEDIAGARHITLSCPACGYVQPLPPECTVHPGGVVSPIFICANEACPCSEWIRLEVGE